ncbi:MAG TPA: DUF1080 domain-containing protein [Gemmatimonadaceae bacterium]|nr:DUF1080 domain-containing protein [Gemmatimonadaceae bacterium]HRQ77275.1 DUF1080 domain-containing protein [Gemmatimonadaceae bacterium]
MLPPTFGRASGATSRLPLAVLAALLFACAPAQDSDAQASAAAAQAGEWIDLQRADAWRGYRSDTLPTGWVFDTTTRELTRRAGKDIITRQQFGSFELELEWKVGPRGNSGIFYWATEETGVIYENATEMQILDNGGHRDGGSPLTSAGANYALYAPVRDVTRPVGEWNAVRIVARGDTVEHWLNGTKVVEYVARSPEWQQLVDASKFRQWPSYGKASRGHIGLQDHGDVVSFRAMRIRELP